MRSLRLLPAEGAACGTPFSGGRTRADLSRRSGVPIRTLEGWAKRARTNPNVYQLYKVAQVLECHIEDLIEPELAEAAKDQ